MSIKDLFIIGLTLCLSSHCLAQQGVFASLDDVLQQAFVDTEAQPKTLWLTNEVKARFQEDLGFNISGLRQRYWQGDERTLWILDEIGKEHPITFAFIIENDQVASTLIMEYRESRGGEIRHDFFRQQYYGIKLIDDKLDRNIDGITGATLSVNAMSKMAKQALWLHREINNQG